MGDLSGNHSSFAAARKRLVDELARSDRNLTDARVLAAMNQVPRHEFVPAGKRHLSYVNIPVPIGYEQTISQPYIVALMTTRLDPQPADRVLEIGTGSGYQAAVLAELVAEVYSIEIVKPLAQRAEAELQRLGCHNVHLRLGDGFAGWPEAAPFDAIIVTCAPEQIPPPLIEQLKDDGRLIIPLGPMGDQEMVVYQKHQGRLIERAVFSVRFVPMTGAVQRKSGNG